MSLANFCIGAHLIGGFAGTSPKDPGVRAFARRIEAGEVGGAILFSYNIESPAQVRELTSYLLQVTSPHGCGPLFIMVDQEGGRVQRLTANKGFVPTPSAQALGEMPSASMQAHVRAMAAQLASVGINVNCAPVVDTADGPRSIIHKTERSFGADVKHIEACARIFVQAHADEGVATSLKHFPGLGAATGDTHQGLIDATAHWKEHALAPFAALQGAHPLLAVMSSHMVNRHIDASGAPLTFSREAMHTLLRDQLQFDGVLISDDLRMGAIAKHFDVEHTVVHALRAGHDLLLFGENEAALGDGRPPAHVPIEHLCARATSAIVQACDQGFLCPDQLSRSRQRLAAWRQQLAGGKQLTATR